MAGTGDRRVGVLVDTLFVSQYGIFVLCARDCAHNDFFVH